MAENIPIKKSFIVEDDQLIPLGLTNFRGDLTKFGIKAKDRRRHMYIIGQTGTGKTTIMENMAIADIKNGSGIGIVDPHGEFADLMLDYVPEERIKDVVYFNPSDLDWPISFNVMEDVTPESRHLISSGLMAVFKKIWPDVWSARMEYILNNTLLALLEYPDTTLLSINRMLSDKNYRQVVVDYVKDPMVKSFWVNEFANYNEKYAQEAVAAIQNKIGQFISNPLIRNIIGQTHSKINLREIIDNGKILIVNLSKGLIGEDNSALLGAILITELQLAAMSRVNVPEEERPDFYLYVDEFQNFSTDSFANILSEARKYHLNLIMAHQYVAQLNDTVRDAIIGNVGTMVLYRLGIEDAMYFENECKRQFSAIDISNLPNFNFYMRLMVDGYVSEPFSALNIPPFDRVKFANREKIKEYSRSLYSGHKDEVEKTISDWSVYNYGLDTGNPSAEVDRGNNGNKESTKEKTRWVTKCSLCARPISVPFEPDANRPVYCSDCLENIKTGKIEALDSVTKNVVPASFTAKSDKHTDAIRATTSSRPNKQNVDTKKLKNILDTILGK